MMKIVMGNPAIDTAFIDGESPTTANDQNNRSFGDMYIVYRLWICGNLQHANKNKHICV